MFPFLSSRRFESFCSPKTGPLGVLALGLLLLQSGGIQAQNTVAAPKKIRSLAPAKLPIDFGISLTPGLDNPWFDADSPDPRDRSRIGINAIARKEWLLTPVGEPLKYRWFADFSPLITATAPLLPNGSKPVFGADQNYQWLLQNENSTLRPPDTTAAVSEQDKQRVETSTAQKHFRMDMGEGGGAEEYGPDAKWPKTTMASVGVTGTAADPILPAYAKVKWHLPYSTVFSVHLRIQVQIPGSDLDPDGQTIDLGDFADEDNVMDGVQDIFNEVNTIDRLKRGTPLIIAGAGRQVGLLVVQGCVETVVAGRTITRSYWPNEIGKGFLDRIRPWTTRTYEAYKASRILQNKEVGQLVFVVTVTKMATQGVYQQVGAPTFPRTIPEFPLLPPGTDTGTVRDPATLPVPLAPPFITVPKIRTAAPEEPLVVLDPTPVPPPTPKNEDTPSPQPAPLPKAPPDGETSQQEETYGDIYFYTQNLPAANGERWLQPQGGNSLWPTGYYYTTLTPTQVTNQMTRGETSFCLFGHPYEWDNTAPVFAVKVSVTTPELRALLPKNNDIDPRWGGAGNPRRTNYYSATGIPQTGNRPPPVPIQLNFKAGAVGVGDVPASDGPFPASNGKWLNPITQQEWVDAAGNPLDTTAVNPATGREYRADSNWEPATGTPLRELTQGAPVRFRRGYPDFSEFTEFTARLEPMRGDTNRRADGLPDFSRSDSQFYNSNQFASFRAQNMTVDSWIRNSVQFTTPRVSTIPPIGGTRPNWVWHHHHDMRHTQLVPSVLNTPPFDGVPHKGGAAWAKLSRW
jgi:hypothetical protein